MNRRTNDNGAARGLVRVRLPEDANKRMVEVFVQSGPRYGTPYADSAGDDELAALLNSYKERASAE